MDYSSNPNDNMHPTTGKHTDGDPSQGLPATIDRADHMNAVYDELLEVITYYGLTKNEADLTQLRQAIQAAIAAAATPDATTAVKGKVELATQTEMNTGTDTIRVPPVNVIATYVAAQLAALVDSSPATLDTLNELAAALGDDPNFATTMTNALATKLTAAALATLGADPISTTSSVQAGRGSGSVALVVNDGHGNAAVAFNHKDGTPEQNGNSGRVSVNVDSLSGAEMLFELGSNVQDGVQINLTDVLLLSTTGAKILGNWVWHDGNSSKSLNTNGYRSLPDGSVEVWGAVSIAADSSQAVTFALAFPTQALNVQLSCQDGAIATVSEGDINWNSLTTTGMTIHNGRNGTYTLHYKVIGK